MRVVLIGGTGHVGSYLGAMLIDEHRLHSAWNSISLVHLDRTESEAEGTLRGLI